MLLRKSSVFDKPYLVRNEHQFEDNGDGDFLSAPSMLLVSALFYLIADLLVFT